MGSSFLLYGASGYVGAGAARLAVQLGLSPVLAGRNEAKVEPLARELGLDHRVFRLDDSAALDGALRDVPLALHLAGPYLHTARPMVDACLRAGAHYLDINGEIPVLTEIAGRDGEAKSRNVMLLPAAGFDVVPSDCLAVHLKNRLPSATHLALAFESVGAPTLPPGTFNTMVELLPFGDTVRRNGELVAPEPGTFTRMIDFGAGPVKALRLTWGDAFTAYYSTGIPNIENYAVLPAGTLRQIEVLRKLRPLFSFAPMRALLKLARPAGATAESRTGTTAHLWGEVTDGNGGVAVSRLHGPEAGIDWTTQAALSVVRRVLAGEVRPGFQTPASMYGPDLVLDIDGVTREDVV